MDPTAALNPSVPTPLSDPDKKKPIPTSKHASPSTPGPTTAAATMSGRKVEDFAVRKKEAAKGKESSSQAQHALGSGSGLKSKVAAASSLHAKEAAATVSPILASSLGLTKMKTGSGPLPQECFFSFKADRGSRAVGSSNLSRPGGGGSTLGSGSVKKKEAVVTEKSSILGLQNNVGVGNGGSDIRSPWDRVFAETGQSREAIPNVQARTPLHNTESSNEADY